MKVVYRGLAWCTRCLRTAISCSRLYLQLAVPWPDHPEGKATELAEWNDRDRKRTSPSSKKTQGSALQYPLNGWCRGNRGHCLKQRLYSGLGNTSRCTSPCGHRALRLDQGWRCPPQRVRHHYSRITLCLSFVRPATEVSRIGQLRFGPVLWSCGLKIRWAAGRQDPTKTDRSCSSQ